MRFVSFSHRHALLVLQSPEHSSTWESLATAIEVIDDSRLRREFVLSQREARRLRKKRASGIQSTLNRVLKEELVGRGWKSEARLFRESAHGGRKWSLDFARDSIAVEVAFNHAEALPHNLVKPTLAGELNHLAKAIQAEVGVLVLATEALKLAGNMDKAVGTYEDALTYLTAYRSILTTPLLLIGLEPPTSFEVVSRRVVVTSSGIARVARGRERGTSVGATRRLRGH